MEKNYKVISVVNKVNFDDACAELRHKVEREIGVNGWKLCGGVSVTVVNSWYFLCQAVTK